jgi:inhibitor of KinA
MQGGISHKYSFFPLGDSGLLIEFGNIVDKTINDQVLILFKLLQAARLPWISDLVPAYSSLAIFYNDQSLLPITENAGTHYEQAVKKVQAFLCEADHTLVSMPRRQLRVPVCYEEGFAPDLDDVAQRSGLSVEEVIHLHTSSSFRIYMIGFLPGFAYMGEVLDAIAVDRRSEPRKSVPAGSVGIAGKQTGIYPFDSPGGWQLIGKTPVSLFDIDNDAPTFFQPGDEVFFYSITANEFTNYQSGAI